MTRDDKYIPAVSYDRLTPLFDPVIRWSMRELELKRRLIVQARIEPGYRVLDLGCGTATLTILIKQMYPAAEVVGLDGDPKILAIAEAKAAKASNSRNWASSSFKVPATCFIALICALPPTRETDLPTSTAGRIPL